MRFERNYLHLSILNLSIWWRWFSESGWFHLHKDIFKHFSTSICHWLYFYISTKSWRGYIFIAVCLCVCLPVCLSVCVWLFLCTKFQPNRCTDLDAVFAKRLPSTLAQTLSKLGQRSKVKVTVGQYPFFIHKSLLISLLCISTFLCLITMKFGTSLRYTLCLNFIKFEWVMTKLWRH